ncbi:MAG: Gfo/Idh/MocA family oxidoreductase [Planctomycetes bacterium]|nr:Gfo/Idh/MocA family oxidoreductase [Planctomycetota bacterium]
MTRFALVGACGFVAPRHMAAMAACGGDLAAALDPHDAAGVLDRWFPEAAFFTDPAAFAAHLAELRRGGPGSAVEWVAVCSPNHLHGEHLRMALRSGARALCEKPVALDPRGLDELAALERGTGGRVFTVLQLRHHPRVEALRRRLDGEPGAGRREVVLTYVTRRGPWYFASWKGDPARSGGLAMNIGVHLFDLVLHLFGPAERCEVHLREPATMAGLIETPRARVRWLLSVDGGRLPAAAAAAGRGAWREMTVDGEAVEFSEGSEDLHAAVYRETLAGRGLGLAEARPSVELVHRIAGVAAAPPAPGDGHPGIPAAGAS